MLQYYLYCGLQFDVFFLSDTYQFMKFKLNENVKIISYSWMNNDKR